MNFESRNKKWNSIHRISHRKASILPTAEEKQLDKGLFHGFISGHAIRTSKGYVSPKLDSLWGRYIIDSFANDDGELMTIALQSCLADVTIGIEGGEYGTPYIIGNYGFYSQSQFTKQENILKEHERNLVKENGRYYLSTREWEFVDLKLGKYAKYGNARVAHAVPGDSIVYLALRESAFEATKAAIDSGVDPLRLNSLQETIMTLLHEKYNTFTDILRMLIVRLEEMKEISAIIPSDMEEVLKVDEKIIGKLKDMKYFVMYLEQYLKRRQKLIEQDKWSKRKAELRREEPSFEIKWNVSQEENVLKYQELCVTMAQSITDRIALHTQQLAALDIREFYRKQQELLHQISDAVALSTPRSAFTSITRPTSAHSTSSLPLLRPISAASTTPSIGGLNGLLDDSNSPPDSPRSRASTSHVPSVALSHASSALSRSSFMSEFSEYSAILPKNLLASTDDVVPTKKTSARKGGPSHKHRLQTTYTINEAGEREYTMSALAPDPVAELDDKNAFIKQTNDDNERILYR